MQFEKERCEGMKCVKIFGRYHGEKCFPSLNNLLADYGSNPHKGNGTKQKFQNICMNEIRSQLRKWKAEHPVILHYYIYEPSKGKKRDWINCYGLITKVCDDALVKCGVLADDGPKYLLNETHDFFYTDDVPGFEVYIEEIENE